MSVKIVKVDGDYKIQVAEGGDITFDAGPTGNVSISGNLSISGTTTYIQTTQLQIEDNIITLNRGELGNGVSEDTAGINIERGTNDRGNAQIIWDENTQWQDPVSGSLQDGLFIFKTTIGGTNGIRTNSIDSYNSDLWFSTGDDGILVVKSNGNYAGLIDTYGNPNSIPNKQWVEDFIQYQLTGYTPGGGSTGPTGPAGASITGPAGASITGPAGESITGPTGAAGSGINILGSKTDLTWLNGPNDTVSGTLGDAYLLASGNLAVYTGSTFEDVGPLRGPAGATGPAGASITGPAGESITGPTGPAGSGGGISSTRTTVSESTGSIANGASANITITGFKGYLLYKIQTSDAAWVRLYTDTASRTADSSRTEGTDPAPGVGVITEIITTGSQTILISPGVIGFSNESSPTTAIPITVTNKKGSTAAITVH